MKENPKIKSYFLLATYVVVLAYILLNITNMYTVFGYIFSVLSPILMGIALAFMLNIPMKFFENKVLKSLDNSKKPFTKKLKRPFAILITLFIVFGIILTLIFFVVPQLSHSISTLINILPSSISSIEKSLSSSLHSTDLFNKIWPTFANIWNEILSAITNVTGTVITNIVNLTIGITTTIVNFFMAFILSIYMLASKEKLLHQCKKLIYAFIPLKNANRILELAHISNRMFTAFITGQFIEAIIIGVMCFVGMTICGMPYSILISIIIAVTALIPIFGAFIGIIPGIFILLTVSPATAFWFIILIIVIQQIEGNIIYPRVVGNSLGIAGIWIMISMLIGADTFGLIGMILGIPLFGVFYTVLSRVVNSKLKDKNLMQ
ncbi:MAG: AI-2E family transporter [Clostridium perfringens]|nr:AI-2E family transporter [Clostridium perfringens]